MLRRQLEAEPAQSPYGAVLGRLVRDLHPPPARGFRGRVYVLDALTAGYLVLAVAYLALLFSRTRSKGGRPLQLIRRVQLPVGELLVVDSSLLLTSTTTATGALSLASLGSISTFGHTGTAASFGLRALSIVPLFLQGWGLLWSALQGLWVATPQNSSGRLPSAKAANCLFLAVGGCVCLTGIVTGFFAAVAGNNLFSAFASLRATLAGLETSSTAATSAVMLRLAPGLSALRLRTRELRAAMLASYSVVYLMTIVLLAVCAYAVRVYALALRPSVPAIHLPLTPPVVDPKTGAVKGVFIEDIDGLDAARMGEEEDEWRFRKAKDDLLLACVTVGTLSTLMAGLGAFAVFLSFSGRIFQSNGALFEIAHLSFSYVYALVQIFTFTFLIHDFSLSSSPPLSSASSAELALAARRPAASCRIIRQVRWLARKLSRRRRSKTHQVVRHTSSSSSSSSSSLHSSDSEEEIAEHDSKGEKSIAGSLESRRSFEAAVETMHRVGYRVGTVVV